VTVPDATTRTGRAAAHSPGRPAHVRTSATGKSRVLALDGLRAFALLIIMGYHFGVGWLQGGFFSLDIFYVLSGYLITGLLLGEWARAARIKLGAFWLRRARRLLPALLVVLVVVTLVVRFTYPAGMYPNLRMADLSALFYFSNWWQIAASGNYFVATGAVSPLTHTWSLAVEEQFYLVWPLVVVAVLHLGKKFDRGIELLLGVSLIGVIASATEMAVLYHPGANITRLYFGTDTHAQSILVGAVLACVLTLVQRRRGLDGMAPTVASTPAKVVLTMVGVAGFAGTLALTYLLTGTSATAYRGGFLLSALSAAAIVLGAVCVAGGPIARLLSLRPLVWMGTVSYGAYLWHFPIFIELDAGRTGTTGLSLLAIRFGATFVLAGLSYYLIERPVMEGTFWRTMKAAGPALVAMGATVAVVVVGTIAPATAAVDVSSAGRIPPSEVQALQSAGAFTRHPVRFMFVGDSLSVTMGIGLQVGTVHRYGVTVINEGDLGCDIDDLPTISTTNGQQDAPVSPCAHWATLWAHQVAEFRPEVVGVLIGRWDILDHVDGGSIVHIGEPAWDRHLTGEIDHVVQVLSSHGAKVVLFTMPYIDPPDETLNGALSPEDSPTRVDEFNHILAEVAARHPGVATVIDLNRILDPAGHYQGEVDGVTVRWADGIHISKQGGEWLQARTLPTIAQLGLDVRARGGIRPG
jgi:peptidoglycan/LPS O-acetylase OafA/YrhL